MSEQQTTFQPHTLSERVKKHIRMNIWPDSHRQGAPHGYDIALHNSITQFKPYFNNVKVYFPLGTLSWQRISRFSHIIANVCVIRVVLLAFAETMKPIGLFCWRIGDLTILIINFWRIHTYLLILRALAYLRCLIFKEIGFKIHK